MELEVGYNRQRGVSLVELLVAVALFGVIVGAVSTIAASVIKAQRKAFALQNVQETSRYLLEVMGKEMRMSSINSAAGSNMPVLSITNAQGAVMEYEFDGVGKRLLLNGRAINPDNLEVTGGFYIRKYAFPASPNRAIVTFILRVRTAQGRIEEQSELNLQSTIASRL